MRLGVAGLLVLLLSTPLARAVGQPADTTDDWGDDSWAEESWDTTAESGPRWHGFYEVGLGGRLADDAVLDERLTLAETRLRLEREQYLGDYRYSLKADLWADGVEHGLHGRLREALLSFSPSDRLDLRIGQQVLTWGTGDLLFLNDLFAKDWVSFFSGREDGYLKAPAATVKASYYSGAGANLDLVWTPRFRSDNFIDGERFSYFSPLTGSNVAAPDGHLQPQRPEHDLDNGEFAARLFGRRDGTEWALYAYRGFWKQPNAVDPAGQFYFSRLTALGASLRGNLAGGIGYTELAWYEGEDGSGGDPLLPNDQLRLLAGYERELRPKLTLGVQYYLEWLQDHAALAANDGDSPYRPDEYRQLWTLRLTYRAMQDNLTLSWFSFWSPSDQDYYLRPSLSYRFDDQLSLTVGGNLFGGDQSHTFFGQFEDASNLYARLRYSF
ncbi:DUF1302 family protein [Marinobacterium arenosum]|uniref:DUF1302 family protein n=1 Tax=Marinobacterium arenosum TaxID=2862496 RepID=UPI001C98DF44|nr:DUF1302 family protein [Marinobacterium arenosum]MBY4675481.1 hypothetical protein [Marinobacterium arenosum]